MKYDIKRLFQELDIFIKSNSFENVLMQYKNHKIKLYNNEINIIISFDKFVYTVGIIEVDNDYYWHLEPYKDSYFETRSKLYGNFDMILLAIKEDVR